MLTKTYLEKLIKEQLYAALKEGPQSTEYHHEVDYGLDFANEIKTPEAVEEKLKGIFKTDVVPGLQDMGLLDSLDSPKIDEHFPEKITILAPYDGNLDDSRIPKTLEVKQAKATIEHPEDWKKKRTPIKFNVRFDVSYEVEGFKIKFILTNPILKILKLKET